MSPHGWLILSFVTLPLIGLLLWVFGQILRARREETETVLQKGLPTEAEITSYATRLHGATVQYRFLAMGWENPISVTNRLPRGTTFAVGDKVAIRYLPGHPHMSVIVREGSQSRQKT